MAGDLLAEIHQMLRGRWFVGITLRGRVEFVDVQAADTRGEIISWLSLHYPGIDVVPTSSPASPATEGNSSC